MSKNQDRVYKLREESEQQAAMKLYVAVRSIVDKGDDVEIRKIKDHLKVSKVSRKSDLEMAI